jgi:thioredoxin-dependent adenylylsulfate APS reductase
MAKEMEKENAESVLQWAVDRFGDRISLSTSFQLAGMVLLDMLSRISPSTRIITLDTGRLPNETYELIDKVQERYSCNIEVQYPDPDELQEIVGAHGVNMFYRSYSLRVMCCEIRKVRPLEKALTDTDAWITGLLRSQGGSRIKTPKVAIDETHQGLLKVNPLADWDEGQVWAYLKANDVPYNALYDQGYSSIGCAPCTRAIEPGEDARAGRWWWESGSPKECGIHLSPAMKVKALKQATVNAPKLPLK